MSKNLTRKGLAFGALVAMGSSVLAGAPAQATSWNPANAITTSYVGTGTSSIEGADFVLSPVVDNQFNYYNPQTGEFSTTDLDQTVYDAQTDYTCVYDHDGIGGDATADNYTITYDNWIATSSVKWTRSNTNITVSGNTFRADSITADQTGTATPYLDLQAFAYTVGCVSANVNDPGNSAGVYYTAANGSQDSNEPTGAATSLTFLNNTGTVLTAALTGSFASLISQDLTTTVTGPTGVNIAQLADDAEVNLYQGGFEIDDNYVNAWSTTDNVGTTSWGTRATGYYTTRVFMGTNGDSTTALSALSGQAIVGQISPDSKITSISIKDEVSANRNESGELRSGTKTFDVSAQLYTTDGADDGTSDDAFAKSGVSVKFEARLGSVADASVIKIGDKTLTSDWVTFTVLTDASGVAKATVTSNNGTSGDDIEVRASVVYSGGTSVSNTEAYNWITADIDAFKETHNVGYSEFGEGESLGVLQNGTITLNFVANDDFGQPLARAGYEYQVKVYEDDEVHNIDVAAPLVNGKATVSIANQEVTGSMYTICTDVEYRAAGTQNWTYAGYGDCNDIVVTQNYGVGAVSAFDRGYTDFISVDDFITFDNDAADWDTTLQESPADWTENYLYGTVVDTNNVPLGGQAVTITSAGVQFTDDNLYTIGSITVYADEYGRYSVEYFTHKAGDNVFTVTSGGKSTNIVVTYDKVTLLHSTDVLTVSAPKAVQAGTVTPVSVKLSDRFGNGIHGATVNLGLVGEGYLSNYSVVTDNGSASVVLINGVNDTSKAYITAATQHATWSATYWTPWEEEITESGASQNFVNKSFTQSVTTGSVATVKASTVKGRLLVDVDNSRNETVRVYVDGKLVKKVVASAHHQLIKINGLKKGKHKVTVTSDYQNLVTKKSVTIK